MPGSRFYLTTPIYYPDADLHIGHAYTTVVADAIARFHRARGREVFFLTGTDEHGQKVQRTALRAGRSPQEFVDGMVRGIQALWGRLGISYDDFIRTTEPRHIRVVQAVFQRLYEQGDIFKAQYQGWYCSPCEAFWLERQLREGKCPDCGRPVELVSEESYFFRVSKYADRLLKHIEQHPDFIQPPSRRNEMISFIKGGLEDLCVSRTTFDWGVPVPFDPGHVVYVWFDALINYISALGCLDPGPGGERFRRYWPADLHLVGKEIVRFHTVVWPIMLMAAGFELPRQVYGHGWLVLQGEKISKSRGNVIDPNVLMDRYGTDAIRYFLLREIAFGCDGTYSESALVQRLNSDLANDLGNLLYRTLTMIEKFSGGEVPEPGPEEAVDAEVRALALEAVTAAAARMEGLEVSAALGELWRLVSRCNKYIDEMAPWALARAGRRERLGRVLYVLAECLRILAVALTPFLVSTPEKMWEQLGLPGRVREQGWDAALKWGGVPFGSKVRRGPPLFPRVEFEAQAGGEGSLPEPVEAPGGAAERQGRAEEAAGGGGAESGAVLKGAGAQAGPERAASLPDRHGEAPPAGARGPGGKGGGAVAEEISIQEFARLDIRVARVRAAEPVPGAQRLLRLELDTGSGSTQVVAGIAEQYRPSELVGKQLVLLANLKPATIRGVESRGMILAAVAGQDLAVLTVDRPIPDGSRVS
ncbi:MAG: methionine--tRNA ligase [Acetobacteraceae bacterium]|nr:methionine--tRNA ligase [Acetobacteraceae bacterium]